MPIVCAMLRGVLQLVSNRVRDWAESALWPPCCCVEALHGEAPLLRSCCRYWPCGLAHCTSLYQVVFGGFYEAVRESKWCVACC